MNKHDIVKKAVKDMGLLDDKKINKGLEEQAVTKDRLSSIFVKLGYVSNKEVGKALCSQIGILPAALNPKDIERKLINLLPSYIALSHRLVPLKCESDRLFLGTDDPLNFLAEKNLKEIIGMSVDLEIIPTTDLDKALEELYASKENKEVDFTKISEDIKGSARSEDAPIIKLANILISEAIKRRASDIHIEPLENKFRVRYRIDGVLHEAQSPPKRLQGAFISRIKIMAAMDIAEKRLPQDGRIKMKLDKNELDLRVSTLPAIHGESVVMRILDKSSFMVGMNDLGFLPDQRKALEKLINLPNGMMLVTGPTGSGKTTTLYAILSNVNQKERKIITIEDPVEYQLDGINQVQVKPQIGLTFANGLRSMLRQAPDIIMVGEIRDLETAQIAVQSALTGHLIFSTLHTNDAVSTVYRLVDMGVKPYLVASTVHGVLAQRLVRIICPACREPYNPSEEVKKMLSLEVGAELYRGKGCPGCSNTGYKGRLGIFELLTITDEIREMILNNVSSSEIYKKLKQSGQRTLKEDGLEKVKRGYTTIEEIMRVTQDA